MPLQIVRNDITKMKVDAIVTLLTHRFSAVVVLTAASIVLQGRGCWLNVKRWADVKPAAPRLRRATSCPASM